MKANRKKKMFHVSKALAVTTSISLLVGCGAAGVGSEGEASSGGEASMSERVTLKVGVFDRGNSPEGMTVSDNYWTDWVQDNFGDPNNIDVEFVPIPRSDATEKLNVMMASGDAPDIAFASTDSLLPYSYAKQGGLADLTDIVEQYGTNLKAYLGEEVLVHGQVDGQQYSIPGKRVYTGRYASIVREDWLEKLDLPMPETTEQVYETLKAFKSNDPGETGGKVIPLGFALRQSSYEPIIWSFIEEITDEERYTLTQRLGATDNPILLPGHKEGLRFLNKLYHEGLMSQDFALDTDGKKLTQDIMNGTIGMYSEDVGKTYQINPGIADLLAQNVPGAKLAPVDPFTNEAGKHTKPGYFPTGFFLMVPKTSEARAVEAVKYLDWMAQQDNLFTMLYGMEGQDHTMQDGIPQLIESDEVKHRMYNAGDMAMITNGGIDYGDEQKNMAAMLSSIPEAHRENAEEAYNMALTDTVPQLRFDRPIEAEIKYSSTLGEKYRELIVKTIQASPADFDKTYDDLVKDYMASGGQEILDERTEAYRAMKK